nr:DUF4363 family protein [Oscillospiraceae bacterium]
MKRSWMGLGLLVVLLALSLLVTWAMAQVHDPIARDLITAGEYALAGDWERAEFLFRQAEGIWETYGTFRACFADHNPMEEIDACFAQLEIYARMREETAFAASCGEIARKAQAMGEAHGLKWENLL